MSLPLDITVDISGLPMSISDPSHAVLVNSSTIINPGTKIGVPVRYLYSTGIPRNQIDVDLPPKHTMETYPQASFLRGIYVREPIITLTGSLIKLLPPIG